MGKKTVTSAHSQRSARVKAGIKASRPTIPAPALEKKIYGCTLTVRPFTNQDLSVMTIEVDVNKATDKKPAWAKFRFHGTPLSAIMRMPEARVWAQAMKEITEKASEIIREYRGEKKAAKPAKKASKRKKS